MRDGEVVEQGIVANALKQLWSKAKFPTKDVVIGVGNQRVLVRETELPWMPRQQLTDSLAYQVGDLLPMHRHVRRGLDPHAHLIPADIDDGNHDVVANDDPLISLA